MSEALPELKLVVLGAGGVGKSALTVQFHQKVFVQEYDPTLEVIFHFFLMKKKYFWKIYLKERKEILVHKFSKFQDNYVKRHDVDGVTYKLSILDTAGQDEFSAFREVYYRSGDGFILVCSFGDESSLREIRQFHSQVRRVREGKKMTFSNKTSTVFTDTKIIICII